LSALILLVDDEKNILTTLGRSLSLEGYQPTGVSSLGEAREVLAREPVDLVVLDVKLPDGNGLDLLAEIKGQRADLPVVMMSGHGTIDIALEAVRRGAHDFIEKPLSTERILLTLRNALRFEDQRQELTTLRQKVTESQALLGSSPAMARLKERIALAAPSSGRVLITGESGTGKELIARALHEGSKRAGRPFVKLNCAAIPHELIESELFGHERGSFTGAHQSRKGKFELAHLGTLFLDEVGDMRVDVQAKLLRALQEGEIERVGGSRPIRVDARVIAATNKDLSAAIQGGEFREDLYYRLNVVPIDAPPLRTRKEDLPELVMSFVARASADNEFRPKEVTRAALAALALHDWPGNVRELKNACERLVILTPGPVIDAREVRGLAGEARTLGGSAYRPGIPMRDLIQEAEREIILAALDHHQGHVTATADALGLERSHLYKKMRGLGMQR
jgi:DNA-binding NtrC family response regulator